MGRRWFGYVDDFGQAYAVELDESNTELVNPSTAEAGTQVPTLTLPRTVQPRTLRYNDTSGLFSRSVVFLSPSADDLAAAPGVVTFDTKGGPIEMQLTSYIGEKQRFVTATDTRQLDGDEEVFGVTPP